MLADRYPDHPRLAEIVADRGRTLAAGLASIWPIGEAYRISAIPLTTSAPASRSTTGRWIEPDGAAGVAWLEYAAWKKSGNVDHLNAAEGWPRAFSRSKRPIRIMRFSCPTVP